MIELSNLLGAIPRLPPALRPAAAGADGEGEGEGPLARDDGALEAFLDDLCRDRLILPGPIPRMGIDVRVPPAPGDRPFRRLVLLAAGILADAEVAPVARAALAGADPRSAHLVRRLFQLCQEMLPTFAPEAALAEPGRAEELARRLAMAVGLPIAGESKEEGAARLAALDSRARARSACEQAARDRGEAVRRALAEAAEGPGALLITPE